MQREHGTVLKIGVLNNQTDYCSGFEYSAAIGLVFFCQLLKIINVEPEYVVAPDHVYGTCNENITHCTGVLELVRSKKADICSAILIPTVGRIKHLQTLNTGLNTKYYFAYASEHAMNTAVTTTFKQPFHLWTLAVVVATCCAFVALEYARTLTVYQHVSTPAANLNPVATLFEVAWTTCCSLIGQKRTHNIALLFACSALYIWYYAGCRGQVLSSRPLDRPFYTLAELNELVKAGKVKLVQQFKDNIYFNFKDTGQLDYDELVKLNDMAEPVPPHKIGDLMCSQLDTVVFTYNLVINYPPCNFEILKVTTVKSEMAHVFAMSRSKFPYKEEVTDFLENLADSGLLQTLISKTYRKLDEYELKVDLKVKKPVTIHTVSQALVVLCVSYIFAALLLMFEIFHMKY